jgi:hypothetical protein
MNIELSRDFTVLPTYFFSIFVVSPFAVSEFGKGDIFFFGLDVFFSLSRRSSLVSLLSRNRAYGCAVCVNLSKKHVLFFGMKGYATDHVCTYRHSLPPTNRYGLAGFHCRYLVCQCSSVSRLRSTACRRGYGSFTPQMNSFFIPV